MNIEMMKPSAISPYPNNPRINDGAVDAVAGSIKEFGFKQPIVVDRALVIIVGHTRWKAALKLNLKEVPVYVAKDLSIEQVKAYRIADNKTNELAAWDYSLLSTELDELLNKLKIDIDIESLGFSQDEIDSLLNDINVDNFLKDEENIEKEEESKTIICPHCNKEFEL